MIGTWIIAKIIRRAPIFWTPLLMLLVFYPSQRRQRKYNILKCNYILFCESSKHEKWKFVIVQKNLSSVNKNDCDPLYTCIFLLLSPLELDERRRRHQVIMWDWHEKRLSWFLSRDSAISSRVCLDFFSPRDSPLLSRPSFSHKCCRAKKKTKFGCGDWVLSSPRLL